MFGQALVEQVYGAFGHPATTFDDAQLVQRPGHTFAVPEPLRQREALLEEVLGLLQLTPVLRDRTQADQRPGKSFAVADRAEAVPGSPAPPRTDLEIAAQPGHESEVVVRPRHPGAVAEALVQVVALAVQILGGGVVPTLASNAAEPLEHHRRTRRVAQLLVLLQRGLEPPGRGVVLALQEGHHPRTEIGFGARTGEAAQALGWPRVSERERALQRLAALGVVTPQIAEQPKR